VEIHHQHTSDVHGNVLQQQAVRTADGFTSTVNIHVAQTDEISHCIKHGSCVNRICSLHHNCNDRCAVIGMYFTTGQ